MQGMHTDKLLFHTNKTRNICHF
ncbi:hypothetical protein BCEN4_740050 [Burkholderia cenocepacia]|nr:hypothetical protein BCEN4_740050 [Burkholderia cenocepacia]